MGLPEHKRFSTHLQAGVSYQIISSVHCPVLTVRLSPKPETIPSGDARGKA
jgi:hypothetical protein